MISLNHITYINLYLVGFCNKIISLTSYLKTAREGAAFMVTGRALYSMGAAF